MRAAIDRLTSENTIKACRRGRQVAEKAGARESILAKSTESKALSLREQIDEILGDQRKKSHPTITERRVGTEPSHGTFPLRSFRLE